MSKNLKLHSPAGSDAIYYQWPLVITNTRDEAAEIIESIRWVCEDFPELRFAFQNIIMKEYDSSCFESMTQLCNRYNKAIDSILQLWKGRAPPPKMFKRPSRELLRHIINLCYNHAVTEPEKLNIYEPFSPEVYGETSFDMISTMLDEVNLGALDTFMDLGSGVGQVVLQVSASVSCKECYGIEKAETPTEFAVGMEREFKKWMAWFGKIHSPIKLEKGDFLQEETKLRIAETNVIFVNNFAFGPHVNHQLKIRFQGLKEGAKVVSSREFCPIHFKFNSRNLSGLGAMMRVTEIKPRNQADSVSWTGKGVSYYLHIVDRTRLEKYFSILKKKKQGLPLADDEQSMCSESNNSSMFENGAGWESDNEKLEDNLDAMYLGATTRHQWQVLVTTLAASKKEHAEKKAQDKRDKEISKDTKLNRKLMKMKRNQKQNLQGKLKKKILEKYEKQKRNKDMMRDNKPRDKPGPGRPLKPKQEREKKRAIGRTKSKAVDEARISRDLDKYFSSMKTQYISFIRKMNTKEYADRLHVMIQYETMRKRLLQKEVIKSELQVKGLLNDGLQLFTARLGELNLAVKTPKELLAKSKALSSKHRNLQDHVVSLESDVYCLEEKYKNLCQQKESGMNLQNMPGVDADLIKSTDQAHDIHLPNKLCSAIIDSLNHRKNLLEEFKDVKEQVTVLEKVTDPCEASDGKRKADNDAEEHEAKRRKESEEDKAKLKPVALVPPRMQGKTGTVSPMTAGSKRSKQRKKSKEGNNSLDNSMQDDCRPHHQRYSYPPDMSTHYHNDFPGSFPHQSQFYQDERSYSVFRSTGQLYPDWQAKPGGRLRAESNEHHQASTFDRYQENQPLHHNVPRHHPHSLYDQYQGNHNFHDVTQSLLQMNERGANSFQGQPEPRHDAASNYKPKSSEILNSSFPQNVSSTTPFWQQYANLAKTIIGERSAGSANTSLNSDSRLSDGSTTDTASVSSQEELLSRDSLLSPSSAKEQRPSSTHSLPVSKPHQAAIPPPKSLTPNLPITAGNWQISNNNATPKSTEPKRKPTVKTPRGKNAPSKQQTLITNPASSLKLTPSTSTKHYITQSAIASFPHMSKHSGGQIQTVGMSVESQRSILEKAAKRANQMNASQKVDKFISSQQSATQKKSQSSATSLTPVNALQSAKLPIPNLPIATEHASKQGVSQVQRTTPMPGVHALKSVADIKAVAFSNNSALSISNSGIPRSMAADNEILRKLGRQIAIQSGTSRTKILLSDLSLPVSSPVLSPPLMMFSQTKQNQGANKGSPFNADRNSNQPLQRLSLPANTPGCIVTSSHKPIVITTATGKCPAPSTGVVVKNNLNIASPHPASRILSPSRPPDLSAIRAPPELAFAKVDSPMHSNMKIYKPGTATGAKSSRKPKSVNKSPAPILSDAKSESSNRNVTPRSLAPATQMNAASAKAAAYTPIVPNPNDRVLYRNPIMTILPAHSRLLVVPNVTTAPSISTNAPSYSTVLYINPQNPAPRGQYPVVVSSVPLPSPQIQLQRPTITTATTAVTKTTTAQGKPAASVSQQ